MASDNIDPDTIRQNLTDLVEPADKKSRAFREPEQRQPPKPVRPTILAEVDNSIISRLIAARTIGHAPIAPRIDFLVEYANLVPFFNQMYDDLVFLIFPNVPPPNLITQHQFTAVCNWLVCMKIQHVRRTVLNIQPRHGVVEYRPNMPVPTALARVLSGLGTATKLKDSLEVFPYVEEYRAFTVEEANELAQHPLSHVSAAIIAAANNDENEAVKLIDNETLLRFTRFVSLMHRRGANFVSTLGHEVVAQHPWYIHGVLEQRNVIANESPTVIVVTFDIAPSPDEILIAAIIQRGFNGIIENGPGLLVETDPITNVLGARTTFNTAC